MPKVFLPHNGIFWLCEVNGSMVTPLAQAPGESVAKRRLSTDGTEFGFLDQSGKRLGHYRLLNCEPWFECITPPNNLPKSCRADDFVIHDGQLIAGGSGHNGEALWVRKAYVDEGWRIVALPEGVGKRGKSIDALFVRDNELIAIDNIMLPKWILVYSLNPELNDKDVQKVRLPTHTTYENIRCAVEGRNVYALFSSGINHGITSLYISLLSKSSLNEVGLWFGRLNRTTAELISEANFDMELPLIDEPENTQELFDATLKLWREQLKRNAGNIGEMFRSVKDMIFCGDHLILALGDQGLRIANATLKVRGKNMPKKASQTSFENIALTTLASVNRLEPSPSGANGFYAIGLDFSGTLSYEWIDQDQIE